MRLQNESSVPEDSDDDEILNPDLIEGTDDEDDDTDEPDDDEADTD